MAGEYKQDGAQHYESDFRPQAENTPGREGGFRPMGDDGLTGALDGLSLGDGKPHDIPETYGNHGTYHKKNTAVGKMRIWQQILSKFPFTKERKERKLAQKKSYKNKTQEVKTTAQRIAEAMEARDAQARAEKQAAEAHVAA